MQQTAKAMRKTGLEVLGERPWGTHFCVFYETDEDLIEMLTRARCQLVIRAYRSERPEPTDRSGAGKPGRALLNWADASLPPP